MGTRCQVCGSSTNKNDRLLLCDRCKRLRSRADIRCSKPNYDARVKALQESWKAGAGHFVCMYSKVPVLTDINDHEKPLYLSLDHVKPKDEGKYVVTCRLINDMKNIMDDDEFRKVFVGLADAFQEEARIGVPDLSTVLRQIKRNYGRDSGKGKSKSQGK
jgi:hypothetical protein